jgi:hypothetical protein
MERNGTKRIPALGPGAKPKVGILSLKRNARPKSVIDDVDDGVVG